VDSAPHPKEIIDLELVMEEDMSVSADVEEGDLLRVVMPTA
jgi:hypothetical protein